MRATDAPASDAPADGGVLTLAIGGEPMQLFADRALYWPARRRLLIADLHLGKADVFRAAGIALPSGGTAHDLTRIDALIAASGAQSLCVLGDVLHGAAHHRRWRERWDAWRETQPTLHIAALRGNHDRALDAAGLDIETLGERAVDGGFLLCHEPQTQPGLHAICGHLHPVLKLPGIRGRLPGFWLRADCTVLPAFSAFTGGAEVQLARGERFAVCAGGQVRAVAA